MPDLHAKMVNYFKKYDIVVESVKVIESIRGFHYDRLKCEYYKQEIQETAQEVGSDLFVGGKTSVNSKTVLGDHVHFMGMLITGEGNVTIGDNFHSGSGCRIVTETHNYDDGDAIPYDDTFIHRDIEIGDNVWIGVDVIVLPGISIEEGAIIQSGSVVTKDIPKGAIAGGHPVEIFDQRDMDHYERLKKEGKFN